MMSENTSANETEAAAANNEALSALLDGAADPLELRRILASADPQLAAKWSRLNAVQAVIHGEASELRSLSANFAARVNAGLEAPAIAGERGVRPEAVAGAVVAGEGSASVSWAGGVAKLAIAASVAVACVVALQMALPAAGPATNDFVATTPAAVVAPIAATPVAAEPILVAADMQAAEQEAQQRLREYIERMTFGGDTPVRVEHIQDSPLYRLVSETLEPATQR